MLGWVGEGVKMPTLVTPPPPPSLYTPLSITINKDNVERESFKFFLYNFLNIVHSWFKYLLSTLIKLNMV